MAFPCMCGSMLRKLYDWTMALAAHTHARRALAVVAFAESSFFPIPPDVMLIPMIVARRAQAWLLAMIASVSSVLGGLAGYAIGYFVFTAVGLPILEFYGQTAAFDRFREVYQEYGAWIVFAFGLTPLPFKLITIASGAIKLNLLVFVLSSMAARSLRFFAVAGLLYWMGPPIRDFIERRFGLAVSVFTILLFAGFVAVRYLV